MPRKKLTPVPVIPEPLIVHRSQVHPLVMEAARDLAGGDMARVTLISPTEVVVRNS